MPDLQSPEKHVIVIGAAGGMGLWAARHWFAELEDVSRVTLCDLASLSAGAVAVMSDAPASIDYARAEYGDEGLRLVDCASVNSAETSYELPDLRSVDLIVLATPIPAIGDVMRGLSGRIAPDAKLIDLASVKTDPLRLMLAAGEQEVSIAGTHPLFGITADSISGLTVALVPTGRNDDDLLKWLEDGLNGLGAGSFRVEAERHDRYMLIAQTMTHFALMAFGEAVTGLLRDDESVEELRKLGTPPYLAMGNMTGRLLTQNHRLYASIQRADGAADVRDAFADAARRLAERFEGSTLDDIESAIGQLASRYGNDELETAARMSERMFRSGESSESGGRT